MRWVAVAMSVAVVGGCKCGRPPECGELSIVVDAPADGAMVSTPAVNVTFHVVRDGGEGDLTFAGSTLNSKPASSSGSGTDFTPEFSGLSGTATGVSLGSGLNALNFNLTPKIGEESCSPITKAISVTYTPDMPTRPDVTSFTFQGDANNDKVINLAEVQAGATTITAVIAATNVNAMCTVLITDQATGMVRSMPTNFTNGSANVPLILSMSELILGTFNFQATITCPSPSLAHDVASDPESKATLRIDRDPPSCSLDAPTRSFLGFRDDADITDAGTGYQLRVLASSTDATTIEIKVTAPGMPPQTTGPLAPMNDQLSRDFVIPATGTTVYTVSVEAKDAAGNACPSAARQFTLDFEAPSVVITSPTDAGSPYNSLVIPITATVTDPSLFDMATGARAFVLFHTDLNNRDLGSPPIFGTMAADAGTFQVGANQTITATVEDLAGNVGHAVPERITVTQPNNVCSIVFDRPGTKPAFITATQLVGGMYNVQAFSNNCTSTPVTFTINGMNPLVANTNASGIASWNVPLTNGMYTFRVDVGSGATANFDTVDVTVNTTAPTVTQPVPGAMPTVVNVAQDTNRAVAGVQRALTFTATVPAGGRVDVCSNQVPAVSMTACPDGSTGFFVLRSGVVSPDNTFTFGDGRYDIKIVVVSGTTTQSSNPVSLFVDSVLPTATAVAFPQEQGTADKRLNIAELNGQAPRITFTLGGADTAATILSPGGVVVRNRNNPSTVYNSTYTITGNMVSVTLDQNITATEADYDWEIVVTDTAGNVNVLSNPTANDPLNTAAILTGYRVDKQAPTCAIVSPSSNLIGQAGDADTAAAGFQLRGRVSTSTDVVNVQFTAPSAATAPQASGFAQNDFTVTEGTYNVAATCTDASGNSTTATPFNSVVVDLTPPTCAMTAPTAMGYPSFSIQTTVTSDANGQPVTVRSSASTTAIGTLTVAAGTASGMLTYPGGMQTITSEVSDLAGNTCTTAGVAININAMGCSITFTSPVIANGKAFINRSVNLATALATGHTSTAACNGQTVRLFNATGTPTLLGMGTTNGSGDVSIGGTLAEGGPYTLRLQIDNGAGLLTDVDLPNVYVDLTNPAVGAVTPTGANLKFVAATNPGVGSAGFVQDLTPGGNADFSASATAITGAVGGQLRVVFDGTTVASQNITTDPQTVAALSATIAHDPNMDGVHTFQIEIADEAGNVIRPTNDTNTKVDVIAPDAPVVTQAIADPRAATVSLQWNPTFNDGNTGGPHDGYDIRWTTTSVTNGNNLATSADYFDSTRAYPDRVVAHSATQITQNITLPPVNTYYVSVRARDKIGNYSAYTAPTALPNPGTMETLQNPTGTASQTFGNSIMANGSVDGDALDDLLVGNTSVHSVYVYFGSPTFGSQTTCAAAGTATASSACQTISHPLGANDTIGATDGLGSEMAVGNFGETTSPDIAIGALGFSASPYFGRTFIIFGGARPLVTSTFVEIRGEVSSSGFGRPFTVPDLNGDGMNELAISAPNENATRGVVYIFRGRSKTDWDALRDGADTFVKASKADYVVDGPTPVGAQGNNFGQLRGLTSLGAFTSGGGVAFTISASNDRSNKLAVFAGSALVTQDGGVGGGRNSADNALLTVTQAPITAGGLATGFGAGAIGNVEVTGSATIKDLIVSQPRDSRFFLFSDGTPTSFGTPRTINGVASSSFATAIGAGDFDGDTKVDIMCTEGGTAPAAWGLFNRSTSGFETQAGAAFWFSKIYSGAVTSTRNLSGVSGNFDGDGRADFVVGDRLASPGKVFVWH